MPQTPYSTSVPYCSAEDMLVYHDWNQVADMLRDGQGARPSYSSLLDNSSNSKAGQYLYRFLLSGAGRIESTCLIGLRYTPADLQGLTGASLEMLIKLNADLSFWQLCQRRQPATADPKNVPGALEALEMLKSLRDGEAIFGFVETAEAALPTVQQAQPNNLLTPNVVRRAVRLFVNAYPNNLNGNDG